MFVSVIINASILGAVFFASAVFTTMVERAICMVTVDVLGA
jgi:hypothetical protein